MSRFNVQSNAPLWLSNDIPPNRRAGCPRFWDPVNARLEPCSLPYVVAIPAVVAGCILLGLVVPLLLRKWISLAWWRPFVEEPKDWYEDDRPGAKQPLRRQTLALLAVSLLGLAFQITSLFYPPHFQIHMIYPTAAWVVICVLIATQRPATPSLVLLALYWSILISQFVVLLPTLSQMRNEDLPVVFVLAVTLGALIISLKMPMRHPSRSKHGIGLPNGIPSSALRSPEDNLTLWQFMTVSWMKPLLSVCTARQLNDGDVWMLSYEFQHKPLHERFRATTGSLIKRILEAHALDCSIITIFSVVETAANLSAPVLLQKILQVMEDPEAPKRAALTYAILSLIVRFIAAQTAVFNSWFLRRMFERCRGQLITMLYEKALSRKVSTISSGADSEEEEEEDGQNSHADSTLNGNGITKSGHFATVGKVWQSFTSLFRPKQTPKKVKMDKRELYQASMGKIYNLLRFDTWEVAQRLWEFNNLITQPLTLIFSIVLIFKLIGWPCLIGVSTVFISMGLNALIARALIRWEKKRREATDKKLNKISQFVESIRHLRLYGWQDVWLSRIMEARQHELKLRIVTSIIQALISFTNIFASGLFPVAAFYAYTALAGLPLRVDIAFPALQLFTMLEGSIHELPGLVTVLINARVAVKRIEDFMCEPDKESIEDLMPGTQQLEIKQASFAWPGERKPVLSDVTLSFPIGLTLVFGQVGSGKTALLQALLGELDQLGGTYIRSNEMVGYCPQTPWLQSMSIRDNILFGAPYDETRYKDVIEACELIPDLASFKHGDLSMIGENGVGLSGGQKARVSLARAVYSRASMLFLDDPLSALDHQTAESIVRRCFAGPLMSNRTIILVTHRTELCLRMAEQLVQLIEGRAYVTDPGSVLLEPSRRNPDELIVEESKKIEDEQKQAAIPDKFLQDEHQEQGGVKASVYWEYIKAGNPIWWVILIWVLVLYRLVDIGETWFLKLWGEGYDSDLRQRSLGPFINLPSPEENIQPWLVGFFVLAVAQALAFLASQAVMLVIVYQAGKNLFIRVMTHVANATFRFYDITPVGRLTNRLTSDINIIDGNISNQFQAVAFLSIIWISSIFVIGSVTPLFLIFALGIAVSFVLIFLRFLPTSQSLRRKEYASLSPLFSNFGALAEGLTTIRAFNAQGRFQDRVIEVTDTFQKMDHFYWSSQAWLMYRFDLLSSSSTFILTSLALYTGVSPGLTAFVLTAASRFVNSTHGLCKQYAQLQMEFVSVERVVEMLHLPQEPRPSKKPPASWPRLGSNIHFENVTIRYATHFEPAIQDISLTIKGGITTALIGRTGSGKTTLALSMLYTTPPDEGRIFIDTLDISTIDPLILRQRVTFLAQEPVLFPGSMRANLDPLDEYTDAECNSVLGRIENGRYGWNLETYVDTGGKNISQGQRQLVGLARALLRKSAVVVMDEATASVDGETAGRVLEVLRQELKGSTVVVVAHRQEAVKGASGCVILSKGRVVKGGRLSEMID